MVHDMINKSTFFPKQSRQFRGKRWLKIILRTLHLIGLAGAGSIFLYGYTHALSAVFLYLVFGSGLFMVALDVWSNGIWLFQVRGQAIILKLILFFALIQLPEYGESIFITIICISGVVSHAPGSLRYYSIYHRKRLNSFEEKG